MKADSARAEKSDRAKRAALIDWLATGGLPDLADETVMERAWTCGQETLPQPIVN
jgi:hypothetical protein